jgi:delta 1-pyrroline-5-carboxylate dehydrogenase
MYVQWRLGCIHLLINITRLTCRGPCFAGQRCSSARVLVLDAGCKTAVMRLIAGGLQARRVRGDVMDLTTDVGPLISADAVRVAEEHCARLEADGATLACTSEQHATPSSSSSSPVDVDPRLFHPRVYELPGGASGLDMLRGEVFAPILHVIEYNNKSNSPTRSSRESSTPSTPRVSRSPEVC